MNEYEQIENYKLTENISVTKRIHPVWLDWRKMQQMGDNNPLKGFVHEHTPILGKYHYVYTSKKGEISLIEMPDYFRDGIDWWEAMAFKGPEDLTHDEMRFRSKQEAEEWIKNVLD